jgi:repressor lexA
MSKPLLTKKQEEIFIYIKDYILKKGYPPTVREIGAAVGLSSTSSIHLHLETLAKKGYIKKDPSKPRTIEIIDESFNLKREVTQVPIISKFKPLDVASYFPIPSECLADTETFIFTINEDSMINSGILSGDNVIVSKVDSVGNGELVAVLLNDLVTVRRFYKEENHVRLQPENDNLEPIIMDNVDIIGRVIGIIRLSKLLS